MRRLLTLFAIVLSFFAVNAPDAFSRGGRGGGRGGRGAGRGRGRSSRSARNNRSKKDAERDAKQMQELVETEERRAKIDKRREELNLDSRAKVMEAYAFERRLESTGDLADGIAGK